MNKEIKIENLIEADIYEPTSQEVVFYSHLDTLFPESIKKHQEYEKELDINLYWHPYDWAHRKGEMYRKHIQLNNYLFDNPIERSQIDQRNKDHYRKRFNQTNFSTPSHVLEKQKNPNFQKKLSRWREVGDVWMVKSNITSTGYATILITSIKEQYGQRYIEFYIADIDLEYATDLDIFVQSRVHSNLSYDIVVYEELYGSLFEDDKRFLHKIGRVHEDIIEKIKYGKTSLFNRGAPFFSESNKRFQMRKIKEFEASLLSKEVLQWLSGGEVSYEKLKLDIDSVKGFKMLNKKHELLSKKSKSGFEFNEIKIPYIQHLWKLFSTYGDNLVLTTDRELSEEEDLILINKHEDKEINIKLDFYNEN